MTIVRDQAKPTTLAGPILSVPRTAARLEVRCPNCGSQLATYREPEASYPSVQLEAKCRRCRTFYVADLRAGAPVVTLRGE